MKMSHNMYYSKIPVPRGFNLKRNLYLGFDVSSDLNNGHVNCYAYHGLFWYELVIGVNSYQSFGFVGRAAMVAARNFDLETLGFRISSAMIFHNPRLEFSRGN